MPKQHRDTLTSPTTQRWRLTSGWQADGRYVNGWHAVSWLVLAVALGYANALGGVFQFDDYNVIVNNTSVHDWSGWGSFAFGGIRPLLKLSYVLNWTSGAGESGFHAFNIAVHLGCSILVWKLCHALLQAYGLVDLADGAPNAHGARTPPVPHAACAPLLAALLFAVHPAHTEVVTYICGRSTSLMALFYLAGVLAYVRAHTQSAQGAPITWQRQWLAPLLFALALSVKETAVTFPLALLLWELSVGTSLRCALRRQWTSWALLLAGAFYFLLSDRYLQHMQNSAQFNSLAGNAATQALALAYLARQWLLPLWLNIDPDLAVQRSLSLALPGAVLGVLWLGVAVWAWRTRPWIGLALAWAFLHWVPLYVFLPRLDVANDRQVYLAAWPLGLALVLELKRCADQYALALVAALVLCGVVLTAHRNLDYHSEIALWESTVRLSPGKSRVHNNLGYAYRLAGRTDAARHHYLVALRLDADNVKARLNLRRLNSERAQAASGAPATP